MDNHSIRGHKRLLPDHPYAGESRKSKKDEDGLPALGSREANAVVQSERKKQEPVT